MTIDARAINRRIMMPINTDESRLLKVTSRCEMAKKAIVKKKRGINEV